MDFDPGAGIQSHSTAGNNDAFVMKLDAAGNFAWAYIYGSTGLDIGRGIAVDMAGTVHLAGTFQGTVDFDPFGTYELTNPGPYQNAYLVKLHQS